MVESSFFMLLCLLTAVLLQPSVQASAVSQQTIFGNVSRISLSSATTTGCPGHCYRTGHGIDNIFWQQMSITKTVTAETLVIVVNNRTNATRTSTVFNTELDLGDYTKPTTVNAAGTATTSIVVRAGSTNSTRYVAFPTTAFEDYPSTYSFCGELATTVNGVATCLSYQDGCDVRGRSTFINSRAPVFTYPSHPPMPEGIQKGIVESDLVQDPRGWTYSAMIFEGCTEPKILFPDLGLWSCDGEEGCVAPDVTHNTALLLTATSTSHEIDVPVSISATHLTSGPLAAAATASQPLIAEPTINAPPIVGSGSPPPSSGSTVAPPRKGPVPQPPIAAIDTPLAVNLVPMAASSMKSLFPASAHGTATPGAQSDSQGQKPEPLAVLPVTENPGITPTTSILVPTTRVNAQGGTIVSTNQAAAVPVELASTNVKGNVISTTSLSPMPSAASLRSAQLVPVAQTSTSVQGSVVVSINSAATIPVLITSTNAKGESVVSTSVSIAPASASAPMTFSSTNAQGVLVSSTSYQPVVFVTSTNAQGFQIIATSQVFPAISAQSALTVDYQAITANSQSQYIIGSQILTPGGAIIVSGTPVSLLPGGTQVVVGSITQPLTPGPLSPFTIGTQIITRNSLNQYIIGSQTLMPGGAITVSNTPISLYPSGTQAIVGTLAETLTPRPLSPFTTPPPLTIGTQTITANPLNQYIIDSQTLTPGGVVTASGTRVSLGLDKTDAVVGTTTEALGPYIMGGLGGGANATGALPLTGGAEGGRRGLWIAGVVVAVGVVVVMKL